MYRRSTAYLLIMLLVLALLFRQPLMALLCLLLLLAGGIAMLWNRWALARVSYQASFSAPRAFIGDQLELHLQVINRKPLPIAMLRVRELIPPGLAALTDLVDRDFHGRQVLRRSTSLRWYEAISWRYQLRCEARGAYRLGPATLDAGDPFGFFRITRDEPRHARLIVYPDPLPLTELGLPATRPIGSLRAHSLLRDPLRTVGMRDYHPDDPLKDVHWGATARTGNLQTRVYEPSTDRSLAIFLDLDTFERYWEGIDPAMVEHLISATTTLARAAAQEGYGFGLYANGAPAEQERMVRLPPSNSPTQIERVLETLAGLTAYSVTPMPRLLISSVGDLPWGATVLLVSAVASEATRIALLTLRDRGRQIVWLYFGADQTPSIPGVRVIHAPIKQHNAWARPRS
jgi:uncharacterized protein (DUF58 family)